MNKFFLCMSIGFLASSAHTQIYARPPQFNANEIRAKANDCGSDAGIKIIVSKMPQFTSRVYISISEEYTEQGHSLSRQIWSGYITRSQARKGFHTGRLPAPGHGATGNHFAEITTFRRDLQGNLHRTASKVIDVK